MRGKAPAGFADFRQGGITPACAGKSVQVSTNDSITWDHPRVCGEKCGSGRKQALDSGITPACAGKSFQAAESRQAGRDHPRVCGEKARSSSPLYFLPGSPPRMRGKVLLKVSSATVWGITPAYAGKSEAVNGPGIAGKDHPRVCGEKQTRQA